MPSDITGSSIFDQRKADFTFQPGPVFTNLLLADEINRTPPKTQAALLEAMQERQVTIDGAPHPLRRPSSWWRPRTRSSTRAPTPCPRPSSIASCSGSGSAIPAPTRSRRSCAAGWSGAATAPSSARSSTGPPCSRSRRAVEDVHVDPAITAYIVDLVAATRARNDVQVGASPRGSLAVLAAARARAALRGRDFVVPEDVKAVAVAALGHRLSLRPELWVRGARGADVIRACLESVPTPPTQAGPAAG